jgi:thioredoxin-related protein
LILFALQFALATRGTVAEAVPSPSFPPPAVRSMEVLSYKDAVADAKAHGRKVFVLFTGDGCVWCERQKAEFFKDSVASALSDYSVAYVDVAYDRELAAKYGVRAIPVLVVLDADGKNAKKSVGYKDETALLGFLGRE